MASADIAANVAIDPENRLFWRMPRQRLEARDHPRPDPGRRRARSTARSAARRLPVHRSGSVREELEARLAGQARRRSVDLAAQPLRVLEAQHPLSAVRDVRSAEPRQLRRSPQPLDRRAAGADPDEQRVGAAAGEEVRRARSRARPGATRRRRSSAAFRLALGRAARRRRAARIGRVRAARARAASRSSATCCST